MESQYSMHTIESWLNLNTSFAFCDFFRHHVYSPQGITLHTCVDRLVERSLFALARRTVSASSSLAGVMYDL